MLFLFPNFFLANLNDKDNPASENIFQSFDYDYFTFLTSLGFGFYSSGKSENSDNSSIFFIVYFLWGSLK